MIQPMTKGRRCAICNKGPLRGEQITRRGLAKAKGGVGRKVTGKTRRWFRPNLQHLKVISANGHVHRQWVCTKCVRSGKITKAPNQKLAAQVRADRNEFKKKT